MQLLIGRKLVYFQCVVKCVAVAISYRLCWKMVFIYTFTFVVLEKKKIDSFTKRSDRISLGVYYGIAETLLKQVSLSPQFCFKNFHCSNSYYSLQDQIE